MEIKKIVAIATYPIRQMILRPGKSITTCYFEGDFLEDTFHFGLFIDDEMIGVVSIFTNSNDIFESKNQMQIRGMAILEAYQKKGFGAQLLQKAENIALINNSNLIWFNARQNAVSFYSKLNYQTIGNAFEIENIGSHFVMFKKI